MVRKVPKRRHGGSPDRRVESRLAADWPVYVAPLRPPRSGSRQYSGTPACGARALRMLGTRRQHPGSMSMSRNWPSSGLPSSRATSRPRSCTRACARQSAHLPPSCGGLPNDKRPIRRDVPVPIAGTSLRAASERDVTADGTPSGHCPKGARRAYPGAHKRPLTIAS